MVNRNPPWTRDELILALDLYFRCDPRHASERTPEIVALSTLLRNSGIHQEPYDPETFRNPPGVYMKLRNFLAYDPSYSGKGLAAGGKLERVIWDQFAHQRDRLHAVAQAIRLRIGGDVVRCPAAESPASIAEDEDEYPEGRVLFRSHRVLELSSALVQRKKNETIRESGVIECEVCGFSYSRTYGQLGEGYIECHHTKPVSRMKLGEKTNLADFILVCSNCHRMLHRGGETMTVEDLRRILSKEGSGT